MASQIATTITPTDLNLLPRIMPPPWAFVVADFHAVVFVGVFVVSQAIGGCIACLALARLFSAITDITLDIWAHTPPLNQVVIEAGALRLEFGCSGGPVPWEFVADFANSQKDAVERGFAVGYKREWWFEKRKGKGKGERVCYAGLRVADVGREVVPPKRGGNEAG